MPPPQSTRRLIIGLTLCLLLICGLWGGTRLNHTERRLVGVWMHNDQRGTIFVEDGREFRVTGVHSDHIRLEPTRRWSVSGGFIKSRLAPPKLDHVMIWIWVGGDPWAFWNRNPEATETEIVRVSEREIELRTSDVHWKMHRSDDPGLVGLYQRYRTGGETP